MLLRMTFQNSTVTWLVRWHGLVMDGGHSDLSINLVREFFTAETIVPLFEKYDVPAEVRSPTLPLHSGEFAKTPNLKCIATRLSVADYQVPRKVNCKARETRRQLIC